jgi:hypothetical protein
VSTMALKGRQAEAFEGIRNKSVMLSTPPRL